MKPVIGVTPLYDDERESIWMLPGYLDVLQACGALPLTLPFSDASEDIEQVMGLVDGILFTGGHDLDPRLYGEKPAVACVPVNSARDALELALLRAARDRDLPIFGICRGIQLFNVFWGGTLWQDIPSERSPVPGAPALEHHMTPPYDRVAHDVTLVEGTPLQRLLGETKLGVNSYHHQGIRALAPGLETMARATDGLVEAVRARDMSFAWAVQWHPEFSWRADPRQRAIIQAFVSICARNARNA